MDAMPSSAGCTGLSAVDGLVRRQLTLIGAVAIGLFVAYPASIGTTYVAFLGPLAEEFGGSRTIPSLGFAMATLGQATGAIFIGPLIKRWGGPRILLAGVPLFSLLVAALALLPALPPVFLTINFAIGLASAAAGVGVYLSIVNLWFNARLGRATGVALLGMSSGMLVLPVAAQLIIGEIGWRQSYLLLALLSLAVGGLSAWVIWRQGEAPVQRGSRQQQAGTSAREALFSRYFLAIAMGAFLAALAGFGIAIHAVTLYGDLGLSGRQLVWVTTLLGVGSIAGRFGMGVVFDFLHAPFVAAAVFGAAALAALYLVSGGTSALAIFFIGLALGTESDVLVFLTRRYFGNRDHAIIYNRLLAVTYLGGMAGPPLLAASLSLAGGYVPALILCTGAFLLATLLIASLGAYPYPVTRNRE